MRFINKAIFLLIIMFCSVVAHEVQNKAQTISFSPEELNYIKSKQVVKVAMLPNFKPFSFIENGLHQGFTVDLLDLISRKSGLNLVIETNSWSENLQKIKDEKVDIITEISYVKKREKFVNFTSAYYEIPTYIFGLKKDKKYKSIEDLANKKVAISYNIYYKDDLIRKGIKVVEVKSSNEKAKQLVLGNVDYFLASYTSGKKAIIQQSLTSIKPIDEFKGVKKEDLRFGIKKQNKMLSSIMQKSLDLITPKEINNLTHKWIIDLKEIKEDDFKLNLVEEAYLKEKKSLKFCIDPNWHPFEELNKKGEIEGVTKEFIDIFKNKLNTPISLEKTTSWEESLKYVKDGKCDFLPLAMKTPKRIKDLYFSNSYIHIPLVLATKVNVPFIDNVRNLNNVEIAIIKNSAYSEILSKYYPNIKFVAVKNSNEGLKKVSNNEAFGFIGALNTIGDRIQKTYIGDLKIGAKFDEKISLSIAINKNEPTLVHIFNKLLSSIDEKTKQKVMEKHILIKYEEVFDYKLLWQVLFVVFIIFCFLIYRQIVQNQTNKKLQDSYDKIQIILDTTMEGVVISKDGDIFDLNQSCLELFAFSKKEDILGKSILEFVNKASRKTLQKNMSREFVEPYEIELIKLNKTTFPALIKSKIIDIKGERFRVTTILDLTDIKEKEALIIQQSKVATAGEMLENISHQWRQPLSQISTIATGVKVQKEFNILEENRLIENMESINSSAQYLSQTIEDFKDFLKQDQETSKKVDIYETIEKVIKLTKNIYTFNNITLIQESIHCIINQNENLLIQALINILNNAKDAINENSKKSDTKCIFLSIKEEDRNIVIIIKDSGGGIKKDIRNKIFEPYFTTKHKSLGTGIGLYMTYQIITKKLEGKITVENSSFKHEGKTFKGACFKIKIPKYE